MNECNSPYSCFSSRTAVPQLSSALAGTGLSAVKLLTQSPAPTMSLMRLARVGGACSPSRVAKRLCFSTMIPSMSRRRAMSVLSGVMGMDSVASRTRVDILVTKQKCKRWTAREHLLIPVQLCASSTEEQGASMMQNCVKTPQITEETPTTPEEEIVTSREENTTTQKRKRKQNPRYLLTC